MKRIDMTVYEFIDKFNKLGDLRQEINEMIEIQNHLKNLWKL